MRNFDHTVNVLVKAYLNDALHHGDCQACAVGNLVRHELGEFKTEVPMNRFHKGLGWPAVFCTTDFDKLRQSRRPSRLKKDSEARKQINATGYTWQELAKIEYAFEIKSSCYNPQWNEDEAMFRGLMAVVDVLAEIHGVDIEVKESAKLLFTK